MVAKAFRLDGKKALVAGDGKFWTGSAASALASAGADVAIAAGTASELEAAAAAVRRIGRKAAVIPANLTRSGEVHRMVERAMAEMGRIDILVNANALEFAKPLVEITKDEWNRVMETNLMPVFLCCQAVGRKMLDQKKGRIINITSCQAERGLVNGSAYCAATSGVVAFTRAMALEWADRGITVNAIGTGWFAEEGRAGTSQEDGLLHYLPLRRYGQPDEIGPLVVYLASDATDFLTGQFMTVDGAVMCHL